MTALASAVSQAEFDACEATLAARIKKGGPRVKGNLGNSGKELGHRCRWERLERPGREQSI